jgi:ABC-type lipoprotein release transport system permease subunit
MGSYAFTMKNVFRRSLRSTPTIIIVAVGSVVGSVGMSSSAERPFKIPSGRQDVAIIVQQRGVKQRLTSVLDEKLGKEIEKIPGVVAASAAMVDFTSLEEPGVDAVVVQAWAADSPMMKKLDIAAGRRLKKDDAKCVLLGKELAAALKKRVGDKMQLFDDRTYTVVGTFKSPISYEAHGVVMLLADLQRAMDRRGQVTGFAVFVDHPENQADIDRIIKAITALGPRRIEAKAAPKPASETGK